MTVALALLRELHSDHENMAQMASVLDWDGIGKAWEGVEVKLASLKKIPLIELKGNERQEARDLIEKVLRLQKLISDQAKPWMDQVRPLLESFDRFPLTSV
jgi:hypothetical protein